MKPLDFTKPITTRDGRKVRILCTDGPNKEWPVVGFKEGSDYVITWTAGGLYDKDSSDEPHQNDLINPPIKRKVEFWANCYSETDEVFTYTTKQEADRWAKECRLTRLACLHFTREYEEGEGL